VKVRGDRRGGDDQRRPIFDEHNVLLYMQGQESKQLEEKRNQKRKKSKNSGKTQGVHTENMRAQSGRGDAQRAHRLENTINELANYLGAQLRGERRVRTHRAKVETETHSKAEKNDERRRQADAHRAERGQKSSARVVRCAPEFLACDTYEENEY